MRASLVGAFKACLCRIDDQRQVAVVVVVVVVSGGRRRRRRRRVTHCSLLLGGYS